MGVKEFLSCLVFMCNPTLAHHTHTHTVYTLMKTFPCALCTPSNTHKPYADTPADSPTKVHTEDIPHSHVPVLGGGISVMEGACVQGPQFTLKSTELSPLAAPAGTEAPSFSMLMLP